MFLMMGLMGRTLNVPSLAGIAFAVGMLVDNFIVVLENAHRHRQMGKPPFKAAIDGTSEVWGAVVTSTLANLAVFIPVLFVQDQAGQLFRDIALAIASALVLSLLVALVVVPTASARILGESRWKPFRGKSRLWESNGHPDSRKAKAAAGLQARIGRNRSFRRCLRSAGYAHQFLDSGNHAAIGGGLDRVHGRDDWPDVGAGAIHEGRVSAGRQPQPGHRMMLPPPGYNLNQMQEMGSMMENKLQPVLGYGRDTVGMSRARPDAIPAKCEKCRFPPSTTSSTSRAAGRFLWACAPRIRRWRLSSCR